MEAFACPRAMNTKAKVLVLHGGAVHSFSNKNAGNNTASGNAYDEKADRRSWQHMRLFFDEVLKQDATPGS